MSLQRISHSRGLTLLEVMIGMAIGLIGIVIIAQVYLVNENYKRSTTGAGGAQINGAIALYTMERDLRMAGYGVNNASALECGQIQYYYNGTYSSPPGAPGGLMPVVLAPVVITDGGAGAPDSVTVLYGNPADRTTLASLSKLMLTADADIDVDNPTGFSFVPGGTGDLAILSQGGVCTLIQVTDVEMSALRIKHNSGVNAPWNPAPGGSFSAYATGATLFNLGRPTVNTYSINASNLRLLSVFTSTSTTVVPSYNATPVAIVNDIVDLQAQYGKDNGIDNGTVVNAGGYIPNDGIVDSYDSVTPANATDWLQVLSVRLGVLARSQNYEKPEPAGAACTATTTTPTWAGSGPPGSTANFTVPDGLPSCYKYLVFETVVPLRNMLWR
jgi:type IV pilus assembly protein PilW